MEHKENKIEHKEGFRKIKPEKMDKMGTAVEMPKERYPYFSIDLMHLPEAKNWEIGKEYTISLKLKQTSMDMYKNKIGKEMGHAGFDIMEIKVDNKGTNNKEKRYA